MLPERRKGVGSVPQEKAKAILTAASQTLQRTGLETGRLRLRLFEEGDFPDFCAYILQKEQQRLSGNEEIDTVEEARALFDWFLHPQHPPLSFAIVLKEEAKVVGNFSLGYSPFLDEDPRLSGKRGLALSFVLNQDYWRRGLMTELLRAALDWVFRETDLDFVNTGYFVFNEGSRRVQEKAGMRPFGSFVFARDDKRIPTVECVLFREEWAGTASGEP